MTQRELTLLNLGQSLDDLCNIDPRGYGVCRVLYKAARAYTGEPLTTNAAKKLVDTVRSGDLVFILTGFVLRPYNRAETDGAVGSALLASALVKAFNATPVIICPQECTYAFEQLASVIGLKFCTSIEDAKSLSASMAVLTFTKDTLKADKEAEDILAMGMPSAVIAIECPGANNAGRYHNASGLDVTELESKTDVLFDKLAKMGVPNIAIGDLGNETGMGTIGKHIKEHIPYAADGECRCGCGRGIAARVSANSIITATVSDWGCYAMTAAIAYLKRDPNIMHNAELEKEVLQTAAKSGLIDMSGLQIPAIDGFGLTMNMSLVTLMQECVDYTLKLEKHCKKQFEEVIKKSGDSFADIALQSVRYEL